MSYKNKCCGILVIGNEILDGKILDTNSNWLEQQLVRHGLRVMNVLIVRDELKEIKRGLSFVAENCKTIITSGGLGPTYDDMTLQAIAEYFGLELVEDPNATEIVKRQYKLLYDRGIVDTPDYLPSRQKMAMIPKGSIALDNRIGGAPGMLLETENIVVFSLPGVPAELKFIFENSVDPWLKERVTGVYYEEVVEFQIRDESVFAPIIEKVTKEYPDVYIKSMPKQYGMTNVLRVWVSARGENLEKLRNRVQMTIRHLAEISGARYRKIKE